MIGFVLPALPERQEHPRLVLRTFDAVGDRQLSRPQIYDRRQRRAPWAEDITRTPPRASRRSHVLVQRRPLLNGPCGTNCSWSPILTTAWASLRRNENQPSSDMSA